MTAAVDNKVTILVVDDSPGTRYSTTRVLRAAGFDVLEAATGLQGLAEVPNADLVILDVNLPDIDGYQVCRKIRETPAIARTPVIHLSASFIHEVDKVRGLNFGADGYLTHPVEAPVLVATINAFLRARKAEDAMNEVEAKFRAIFDQTPQGIALVSQDFVYLEVNPSMCHILGRSREQIVGKHNSAFIPAGREKEVVAVAQALQQNEVWRGHSALLRSDASRVELEWTISSFSVPGVRLALVTDITDRIAIEEERERLLASERAARAEAERANRLKDDFLATLSHELRTPLNAIVGWSEILSRGTPDPADLAEGLEAIDRNVKAQSQLIADLLDVSRITSGKLRLQLQSIDAGQIVNAALDAVMSAAAAKGIVVRRHIQPGRKILADPGRLQQILWNLVTNAVKFTPAAGTVDVGVAYTDGHVLLSVTDSGNGIAPEFIPYLFDRFSQADASSRRQHGGLGLGLAIVKNLVEMHGGTVHAESDGLGKGSRFIVSLPLTAIQPPAEPDHAHPPATVPHPAAPHEPEINLRGVRILLVDDDLDARNVVTRLLVEFEATVTAASSVNNALAVIEDFRPTLLISDIGMPGRDGYDLARELRRRPDRFANLPALALTAFAGADDIARAHAAGFDAHLAKPVDPTKLVAEIHRLTRQPAR